MARIPGVLVLFSLLVPAVALGDTVYLKNGEALWCKYTREESDQIVLIRPSGDVRVRKAQISWIEPIRNTFAPYYVPGMVRPAATAARSQRPVAMPGRRHRR